MKSNIWKETAENERVHATNNDKRLHTKCTPTENLELQDTQSNSQPSDRDRTTLYVQPKRQEFLVDKIKPTAQYWKAS